MKLWGFGGRPMATQAIALTIAEMITRDRYGEAELKAQQPFQIEETPDRWIIAGSRDYDENAPLPGGQLMAGKVSIEILKANCRVIKFIGSVAFLPPEKQPRKP